MGTYNVRIQGDAMEDVSQVTLIFEAEMKIRVDPNGNYQYSYDTICIPPGEFSVIIGDVTSTVTLDAIKDNN